MAAQVNPEFAFVNAAAVSKGKPNHAQAPNKVATACRWQPAGQCARSTRHPHGCLHVVGVLPLQLAAHKALTYRARGRLVSKSLHAELVYNLSGSKHVGLSS